MKPYPFGFTLSMVLGVLAGIGGFTFYFAKGTSYFSTDPTACTNCHIMREQFDSWTKSSHHAVATCVQCHLPHDFIGKWLAKASNGYHHSVAFTFGNFHEPIQIGEGNRNILKANCLECHGSISHELVKGAGAQKGSIDCLHCHSRVGHGP